ncbi:HORMA domain-containing protein [Hamiltosporidium magnivora]|uniref:HORMA domain-containing protein n=1 Tax=Hamiltosporidium magnivora TaxID=148818 RepID=A0A4V6MVC1_9MICR|nr:HORMA domain-containing protein [Hamiltosporidium magnivora]
MNEIVSDEFFDSTRDIYTDPFIFYRENSNRNGNEAFVHQTNTTEMTIISSNITEEVDTFQKISLCIDNQNSSDLLSTNNLSDKLSILLHILTFTSFLQQQILQTQEFLQITFSSIAYLRDIFSDDCFDDFYYDNMKLKILKSNSTNTSTRTFLNWLTGCKDAIQKKYLKSIIIAIYLKNNTEVTETYTFDFNYSKSTPSSSSEVIKTLCKLTQTLKPLPSIKYITIKLFYYDQTPINYEPPGFKPTNDHRFEFETEPLKIEVGDYGKEINTNVKIHTLYDENNTQEIKSINLENNNFLKDKLNENKIEKDFINKIIEKDLNVNNHLSEKQNIKDNKENNSYEKNKNIKENILYEKNKNIKENILYEKNKNIKENFLYENNKNIGEIEKDNLYEKNKNIKENNSYEKNKDYKENLNENNQIENNLCKKSFKEFESVNNFKNEKYLNKNLEETSSFLKELNRKENNLSKKNNLDNTPLTPHKDEPVINNNKTTDHILNTPLPTYKDKPVISQENDLQENNLKDTPSHQTTPSHQIKETLKDITKANKEDEIRCICYININDLDMLQCDTCKYWLHTVCCGYFSNSDKRIPKNEYTCYFCRQDHKNNNNKNSSNNNNNSNILYNKRLAIIRRSLSIIYNENVNTLPLLSNRVGISIQYARSLIKRFIDEGFLVKKRNKHSIFYDLLKNENTKNRIKQYFSLNIKKFNFKSSMPLQDIKCGNNWC